MIYCILLLLFSALCCGGMEIIRNGVPCAEIVIDKKAHTEIRFAAEELRLHLRKISGASLPVTTKSSGRFPVKICVGESPEAKAAGYQLPRWDGSGYDIWIRGGTVVLNGPLTLHTEEAGNRHPLKTSPVSENIRNPELSVSAANDNGPMHAVSAFLERLGVRFYAPYEGGTVYPCLKTVAVQEGRETRTAAFSRREYQFGIVQADDAEGIRWLKRLKSGSGLPAPCTIRLADILAGQETKHPEWFSLDEKGVPLKSEEGCGVPRYTHPGLQRKCIEEIRKFLDRNPAAKTLEVQEPHSQTLFTDWRDLKAWKRLDLFPSNNPASDIYFHFLSVLAGKIAESHPDRKLIWKLPKPQKLMEDKLLVIKRTASLSAMPPALPAGSYASEKNRQSMLDLYERLYNAFRKEKMQQREWWNDYVSAEIPPQINFFAHAIQQMRRSQRLFLDGFLMDVAADREQKRIAEAPLAHLMLYINSKLLWDPDLDMDSLLDEYYRFRFGPAAGEMKTFFRFAEHVCAREKSRSISENGGQLTPNDIPVWFELLKQAKSKTEKGSVYAKRIESLEEKTAWMKSVFRHRTPAGAMLRGDVLPHKAKCDLDLAKYTNWQTLDHGADCSQPEERTEFAVAATENGSKLFAAFRCYRKDMPRQQNDPAFPSGDSVRLLACTPQTAWICITADASGNASAQMLDPKILFQAWQPSDRKLEIHTKVRYYSDRWELEFSVSLAGWGRFPNWHPPWGINAVRTRRSGEGEKSVSAVPDRWSGPVLQFWHCVSQVSTRQYASRKHIQHT